MALIKAFETSFGVDATFWVMESIPTIDKRNSRFCVMLSGYLNREAWLAGSSALMSKQVMWEGAENYPIQPQQLLDQVQIYGAIAAREDWTGCTADATDWV